MKLRRQPLLLAAAVGVVLLAAWWWPRSHGPTYQGRDVREWLLFRASKSYSGGGGRPSSYEAQPDVLSAFRAMGTNSIAPLIEVCMAPDESQVRYHVFEWLREEAPWVGGLLPDGIRNWLLAGYATTEIAYDAVRKLHPPAVILFPLLTNRLSLSDPEHESALILLSSVGDHQEEAARMLAPFLTNSPFLAMRLLERMGLAIAAVLPELITSLPTVKGDEAYEMIHCLGMIGPAASNALPFIRIHHDREPVRLRRLYTALDALQISLAENWAEKEVRSILRGTKAELQQNALQALRYRTNISSLVESDLQTLVLRDKPDHGGDNDPSPWSTEVLALRALLTANLDHSRLLPVLSKCLHSPHCYVQVCAADKLLEWEPSNRAAFVCLTNMLGDPPYRQQSGYSVSRDFIPTGHEFGRIVVRLTKIAPVNPEAQRVLDTLRLTPSETAEIEKRFAELEDDAP